MNDRQRLKAIISVINKYLPPDGIPIKEAMSDIISYVDPLPPLPVKWTVQEIENGNEGIRWVSILGIHSIPTPDDVERYLGYALAQPEERNFCPRCGKRTADIHTCTPPKENT